MFQKNTNIVVSRMIAVFMSSEGQKKWAAAPILFRLEKSAISLFLFESQG